MKLEISFSDQPKGIELLFSEEPTKALALRLKTYGFKKGFLVPLKWTAPQHPAYITYANKLKEAILKKSSVLNALIEPSFEPSQENIDHNKFSYVTISHAENGDKQQDSYVVFDSYLKVATAITNHYGTSKYGDGFIDVSVTPRKFKRKARKLLSDGMVITGLEYSSNPKKTIEKQTERHKERSYRFLADFSGDVIKNMAILREQTLPQMQVKVSHSPAVYDLIENRFNEKAHLSLTDAQKLASEIIEKELLISASDRKLTNDHGVYTKETAGDRYEIIDIPMPKTTKFKAHIKMVKDEKGLYRIGITALKEFGDAEGQSSPVSNNSKSYPTRKEALERGVYLIYIRILDQIARKDAIWSDQQKKNKMLRAALKAVREFAKKNDLTLDFPEEKETQQSSPSTRKETNNGSKSIALDIVSRDTQIPNVLVPQASKEPFISKSIFFTDAQKIQKTSPDLLQLSDDKLPTASAVALFELSQMPHPTDYGLHVSRSALLREWEKRGETVFKALGFPTDLDYPYVNINTGYSSVYSLGKILGEKGNQWWSAVESHRPIADLDLALDYINDQIKDLKDRLASTLNPKTDKPKNSEKERYRKIIWDINQFEGSQATIHYYLNGHKKRPKKQSIKKTEDHLDKVIAYMHEKYAQGIRPTKKQIEQIASEIGVPNMGVMWEYTELSWLLWYQMLYKDTSSFENRLLEMIRFWDKGQPTYAYSDSSKEIYKQYSTPCPIGAIIAQYTEMEKAENIFEPSAGNGLLLIGADPKKTHVNEIDTTRAKSLEFQGFKRITHFNAAEPFPDEMTKKYDVVVTNPPFAKWEEEKFSKDYIIRKYFSNHRGLSQHIRLEHLMAGLALLTMKDNGKAAIIIMGHAYFGADGLLAKYRPFFNWLYRHYRVDDIINMDSYKLYNKQGAVAKTMLILIGGRKPKPKGVAPTQKEAPHLNDMVSSFWELWLRVKPFIPSEIDTIIQQLKIELKGKSNVPLKEKSPEKMECYIDYLDAKNNFKKTRKDFESYDAAMEWMKQNLEKWDLDMIYYYKYEKK